MLLVGKLFVSSILEHPGQYVSSLGRGLPTKVYDELDSISAPVRFGE